MDRLVVPLKVSLLNYTACSEVPDDVLRLEFGSHVRNRHMVYPRAVLVTMGQFSQLCRDKLFPSIDSIFPLKSEK